MSKTALPAVHSGPPKLTVDRTQASLLSFIVPKLGVGTKQEIVIWLVRNSLLDY